MDDPRADERREFLEPRNAAEEAMARVRELCELARQHDRPGAVTRPTTDEHRPRD